MGYRAIKKKFLTQLSSLSLEQAIQAIDEYPPHDLVHPLFSSLCNTSPKVKWHGVSLFGTVTAQIANLEMEKARIIMRRCMWMLNDESGGIGWGVPEAMASAMACHQGLAMEYCHILVAYMREDGFYLELEPLQRGLMWGLGHLAQQQPQLLLAKSADRYLPDYLQSKDATVRGLAARALGLLGCQINRQQLLALTNDFTPITLYENGHFQTTSVAQLSQTTAHHKEAA